MIRESRKRKYSSLKRRALFILFAVISAVCIICTLFYMNAYAVPIEDEIIDLIGADWEVYTFDGGIKTLLAADTESYYSGLKYPGQTFYASTALNGGFDNAVLQTDAFYKFAVFLDDDLIYTDEIAAGTEIGSLDFSGSFTQNTMPFLIALPDGYAGKTLTIAQAQPYSENPNMEGSVFLTPVKLYSAPALWSVYTSSIADPAYLSAALLITGIILTAIFLFGLFKQKADFGILFLSLFVFSWIFNILMRFDLAPYYFGAGEMWFDTYFYYCEFIFLNLFLLSRLTSLRRFYLLFIIAQAASVILFAAAQNFMEYGDLSVFLTELPQLATFFSVFAGIAFAIAQAFAGSALCLTFAKVLACCVLGLGIYYIISIIAQTEFYGQFNYNWSVSFTTGLFYYPLNIVRYLMTAACFISVVIEFIRYLIKRNVELNTLLIKEAHAKESYEQMNRHAAQISELKHDLKKHLVAVDLFLQKNDVPKARGYLKEVGSSIENTASYANTGNELIDAVLNGKISECEKKGVKINCTFSELPEKMPFADTDIVSLILNSTDNALGACLNLDADDKAIKISIHIKNGFLYYSCINKFEPRTYGEKAFRDGEEHGYGLKIIKKTAEKYGGIMEIKKTEDVFELNCALPVKAHLDK